MKQVGMEMEMDKKELQPTVAVAKPVYERPLVEELGRIVDRFEGSTDSYEMDLS
jgi:hypothetical protein